MKVKWFALLPLIALVVCGCKTTAPTHFESSLFDIKTNYVQVELLKTNTIWQTNIAVQTINVTNTQGVIVPVLVTNPVVIPTYEVKTITNFVEAYDYQRGSNAAKVQEIAGGIGNVIAPGVGGPIASAVVGFLLAGWGWWRSSKRGEAIAGSSVQIIEAAREILKSMPNGAAYDNQLTAWMQQHQAEAGILTDIMKILERDVNNADAQTVATQIRAAVAALQKTG